MDRRKRLTQAERKEVHSKMNGHCAYCGCSLSFKKMQVDHVVALRIGGADGLSNMLPSCRSCNHYKSSLTLEGFRGMLQKMPDTLLRDSVTYKNAVRFGLVVPNNKKIVFYYEKK